MLPMGARNPDARATMRTMRQPMLGVDAGSPELRLQRLLDAQIDGLPALTPHGSLPRGTFATDWATFAMRFGDGPRRDDLRGQLHRAMPILERAGIDRVLVVGSMASNKADPGDVDLAWVRETGRPYPAIDFDELRRVAPDVHLYRADDLAPGGRIFAEYFGLDRAGAPRGNVLLTTGDATLRSVGGGIHAVESALLGAMHHLR